MGIFPSPELLTIRAATEGRKEKKYDVMRLVEAIIAGGGYDLDPQETVDVAFKLLDNINRRLIEESNRYHE